MPAAAVCLESDSVAAMDVLTLTDGLKMPGAHTVLAAAEMVDDCPAGDWADQLFVREAVRGHRASPVPELPVTSAGAAGPEPAILGYANL
jgi:hypothetical protein